MSARIEERRAQLQKLVDMAVARQASAASPLEASDTMISQMIGAAIVESLIDIAESLEVLKRPAPLPEARFFMGVPLVDVPREVWVDWLKEEPGYLERCFAWLDKYQADKTAALALAESIGQFTAAPAAREFKTVAGKRDFKPATQASRNEADLAAMRDAIAEQSGEVVERPARQLHPGMPLCPHKTWNYPAAESDSAVKTCADCGKEVGV